MSGITMTNLSEVNLGKLETSVADWKKVVGNLKELADRAEKGLLGKSESARWAGVNSDVTKAFVRKTANEFEDARAEADSIYQVLSDAHTELVDIQKKLHLALHKEASALGVKVEDYGNGGDGPTIHVFFPHDRTTDDTHTQEELDKARDLATRIANLVAHAQEIDASVARALRKSHGGDKHDFGHETYKSLDDAQEQRASELAKLGPKMSNKQFEEFNNILKWNRRDHEFSTAFYRSLGGPKETLEFYGRMSLDGTDTNLDKARLELTKDLQRNMGVALATATDVPGRKDPSWPHLPASWGTEFRRLGTQQLQLGEYPTNGPNSPYGYQVLGGLLRYGNYDPKFINPIAGHLVQLHHDDPNFFTQSAPMSMGKDDHWGFNPSGKVGEGYDPLPSVLEGLGHSPEAAKEFFKKPELGDEPYAYNEDGTINKSERIDYDYFDELTDKDFKWMPEGNAGRGDGEARLGDVGADALGHALEAATTGHAYDASNPVLHRDEQTGEIMKRVIEQYNITKGSPPDPMMDSLAKMGASYIDDLNYSTYEFGGSSEMTDRNALFANSSDGSPRTDFHKSPARSFMMLVAGDEDGYKALSSAQQLYAGSGLAAFEGQKEHGIEFAANSAEVNGILDASREHQIHVDYKDAEEKEDLANEKHAEWKKTAMSGAIAVAAGGGTAMILGPAAGFAAATAVPLVVESGGAIIDTVYGNQTMDYLKENESNNDGQAIQDMQNVRDIGERATWIPVENYGRSEDFSVQDARDAKSAVEDKYDQGRNFVDQELGKVS
ncbi:hypothetical protein ACFW9D_07970 [Streptomyces sp. NPDC059524]|uniref:hypothetical protein n=1 Tax=Streptomyces sp. NPDC059524 TaxID=3346856 RepID=UPI0036CB3CC9